MSTSLDTPPSPKPLYELSLTVAVQAAAATPQCRVVEGKDKDAPVALQLCDALTVEIMRTFRHSFKTVSPPGPSLPHQYLSTHTLSFGCYPHNFLHPHVGSEVALVEN